MSKFILKESDYIHIRKLYGILKETDDTLNYEYFFKNNNTNIGIYFVKEGDRFRVFADVHENGSMDRKDTGLLTPLMSELGAFYNHGNESFPNNKASLVGNNIARYLGGDDIKRNTVVYVNEQGIPYKGVLKLSQDLPATELSGTAIKLKDGKEILFGKQYFVGGSIPRGSGAKLQLTSPNLPATPK